MITPTDVMHGNFVMYDNKIFPIDCISTEIPSLNTIAYGIGVVSWKDLKAVRVDGNILDIFGFEWVKDTIEPTMVFKLCWDGENYWDKVEIKLGDNNKWYIDGINGKVFMTELHNLQNFIYFNFYKNRISIQNLEKAKVMNFDLSFLNN